MSLTFCRYTKEGNRFNRQTLTNNFPILIYFSALWLLYVHWIQITLHVHWNVRRRKYWKILEWKKKLGTLGAYEIVILPCHVAIFAVRIMGKRDSCNIVRDFVEWHGSFEDKLINTIHSYIITCIQVYHGIPLSNWRD